MQAFKIRERCLVAGLLVALVAPFPARGQNVVETFPLSQVRPGLKGVGRTIFQDDRIEEFQVEVLGVLKNAVGPKHDVILARLSGGPLAKTGVILGMSGSPVYVDGKLLGAVSLAFPFTTEAMAGITPIQEILDVVPESKPAPPALGARLTLRIGRASNDPVGRVIPEDQGGVLEWEKFLPAVDSGRDLEALRLPLRMSGFSAQEIHSVTPLFERMGFEPMASALLSSGSLGNDAAEGGSEKDLVPGSMVSVYLMRGDLNINADCTVTARAGNSLFACGHRFLMSGPTAFPFGEARVLATIPSLYASFKLDAPGPPLGSIRQDRFGAIYGVVGDKAPMVPVRIRIATTLNKPAEYNFELVEDPFLTPLLANLGMISTLASSERMVGPATFEIKGGIELSSGDRVEVEDVFSGDANTEAMAGSAAARPLALLLGSGFPELRIGAVQLSVVALNERRVATLDQAWANRSEVRPGDAIEITALLRTPGGETLTEKIPLDIPVSVSQKTLSVVVGSGTALNLFQNRLSPLVAPRDLAQLVRALNRVRRNNRLYALLMAPERSFIFQGDEYPSPPPSLLQSFLADSALASSVIFNGMSVLGDAETKPSTFAIAGQRVITLKVEGTGE